MTSENSAFTGAWWQGNSRDPNILALLFVCSMGWLLYIRLNVHITSFLPVVTRTDSRTSQAQDVSHATLLRRMVSL